MPKKCVVCNGTGSYHYDENHGKKCEYCCLHDQGWWPLTEDFSGYVSGEFDNHCCKAGCGTMRRDYFHSLLTNYKDCCRVATSECLHTWVIHDGTSYSMCAACAREVVAKAVEFGYSIEAELAGIAVKEVERWLINTVRCKSCDRLMNHTRNRCKCGGLGRASGCIGGMKYA